MAPSTTPQPGETPRACSTPPSTWLVLGDKLGDNAQIEAIASALDWPVTTKRLRFRDQYVLGKPAFKASLYHIDLAGSDALVPPWPDLVLTVGRRPSMAAMWIRAQSGGRTKVVIVGRPRRMLKQFALVLATPQYRLPARANVLHLDLPLMRIDAAKVAEAARAWQERFDALERPLTAVFVGGPTKPFRFTADVVEDFVARLTRSTGAAGTLFVSTSRRTPAPVVAALESSLPANARLYRWQAGASENPYLALLGAADRFVVTGDSISMIVEVARLGRPLAIFPLPIIASPWDRLRRWLAARFQPPAGAAAPTNGPLTRLGDLLYETGLVSYARDFAALHQRLVARGLAVFLGLPLPAAPATAASDDLPAVVARIRALFAH